MEKHIIEYVFIFYLHILKTVSFFLRGKSNGGILSVVGAYWNPKANGKQLSLLILSCGICFWLWMNLGGLLRAQSWNVQSWFKISQNNAKLEIKYESLKSQFSWINFVYNLIIGCAKKNRENYLGEYIWTKGTRTHNKV